MSMCETCGNAYDKAFTVIYEGQSHTFDCFECAISKLAPHCSHCDVRIIGHGMESGGSIYCCANCAESHGVRGLRDRADLTKQH